MTRELTAGGKQLAERRQKLAASGNYTAAQPAGVGIAEYSSESKKSGAEPTAKPQLPARGSRHYESGFLLRCERSSL